MDLKYHDGIPLGIITYTDGSDVCTECVDKKKKIAVLVKAIKLTLKENAHLADGDNCSLIRLKRALESIKT